VLYGKVNKVENLLVKFDSFVKTDVLLTVCINFSSNYTWFYAKLMSIVLFFLGIKLPFTIFLSVFLLSISIRFSSNK
jgi:hypothetical protein